MKENDDKMLADAVVKMASIFESEEEFLGSAKDASLWSTCQQIASYLNLNLKKPILTEELASPHHYLTALANASNFRTRQVRLSEKWWETDNGPLIAFDKNTRASYALIFTNQYQYYDTFAQQFKSLSPEFIKQLAPISYSFYRNFPNQKLGLRTLFSFTALNQKSDFIRLLLLQCFIGLLGLFIPIATGIIMDTAIPNADRGMLEQFFFGLVFCSIAATAFNAAQTLSMLRIRFKTNAVLQPAVWDRLLRLPVGFFKQFSPGDLTQRASAVDTMQQEITGASLNTFLGGIFSTLTLALMMYYSPLLTLLSALLALFFVVILSLFNIILLKYQRIILQLQGILTDQCFQFINSISKLRISHSESRAFALWAKNFAKKTRLTWLYSLWSIRFTLLQGIFSAVIFIWLYVLIGTQTIVLSFGSFIAFNAAFTQFFQALLALAGVVVKSIDLIPLYERIQPILKEDPEEEGIELKHCSGAIQLKNLSFSYHPQEPLILDRISLNIQPGEFLALAGATGSGKSTLFRLLLGFETPTHGGIFYDKQDLSKLSLRSLRSHLGVVLQNAVLLPGSIFENIAGMYALSIDDAWDAAEQAGLAEDIQSMPMGMHTVIVEGGKTLSMGQKQRVLIARALVTKPRILLLDEATSALDNYTQSEVMNTIEALKITRIVAAHRLSTIMHADRIVVIDEGHIVQMGTYSELINKEGYFSYLVKQQTDK